MRKALNFSINLTPSNSALLTSGRNLHIMRLQRDITACLVRTYQRLVSMPILRNGTKPHWAALPSQVVQDVVLRYGKSQGAFLDKDQ